MQNASWQELVYAAFLAEISLCVQAMYELVVPDAHIYNETEFYACFIIRLPADPSKMYPVYGVTVSEVEIDVLTGQHLIRRVDILEDIGISMNPDIDRGQVEGAFIMGVGYWTCEDLIYDPSTGLLTNYRTWVSFSHAKAYLDKTVSLRHFRIINHRALKIYQSTFE